MLYSSFKEGEYKVSILVPKDFEKTKQFEILIKKGRKVVKRERIDNKDGILFSINSDFLIELERKVIQMLGELK